MKKNIVRVHLFHFFSFFFPYIDAVFYCSYVIASSNRKHSWRNIWMTHAHRKFVLCRSGISVVLFWNIEQKLCRLPWYMECHKIFWIDSFIVGIFYVHHVSLQPHFNIFSVGVDDDGRGEAKPNQAKKSHVCAWAVWTRVRLLFIIT